MTGLCLRLSGCFPVDNSSAKIVPKISYASKVKENLNKTVQNSSVSPSSSSSSSSTGETQTQSSSRLSQVPMSALKSVTSASFSNGPVLAGTDGSVYPSVGQPLLTTAANTLTPISTGTDSVLQDMSLSSAAVEQIKSSLFIYPSNMQTVLLSAQVDLPSQTDQQNLGDIFQNSSRTYPAPVTVEMSRVIENRQKKKPGLGTDAL